MIASLAMYDWPEVRDATDALWAGIAQALSDEGFKKVPDVLNREMSVKNQWRLPQLLLSQTCGYPLTHEFAEHLQLLATPVYGVEGCEGGTYTSAIIVNKDSAHAYTADLIGARAAYNTDDSMSGHLALRLVFAPLATDGRVFGEVICSGSHARSMAMVAENKADVAAIDCVSLALCRAYRSEIADRLRVIAWSPKAPSLPYVTAIGRPGPEVHRLKQALAVAFADPTSTEARASLFIEGLEFSARATYDRIPELEAAAQVQGFAHLA